MQQQEISLEKTSELGRKLSITLESNAVNQAIAEQMQKFTHSQRLNGFRRGKAISSSAKAWMEQKYGKDIRQAAVSDLIKSTLQRVIEDKKLKLAEAPVIEEIKNQDLSNNDDPVSFTAKFEILPEIELADFSKLKVKQPVVEISETDLEKELENLKKRWTRWTPVERPAKIGDRLTIDFTGLIDDKPFANNQAKDYAIILGSGNLVKGFEEELVGSVAKEEKTITIKFPENWPSADLSGKQAQFKVIIHSVAESELPELTKEFIQGLGIESGDISELRELIKRDLKNIVEREAKQATEYQVADQLINMHNFSMPESMVNRELANIIYESSRNLDKNAKISTEHMENCRVQAERRTKISFILNKIISKENIRPDEETVKKYIYSAMANFRDPELVNQYKKQRNQIQAYAEQSAIVEKVYTWLLDQASKEEVKCNVENLLAGKFLADLERGE